MTKSRPPESWNPFKHTANSHKVRAVPEQVNWAQRNNKPWLGEKDPALVRYKGLSWVWIAGTDRPVEVASWNASLMSLEFKKSSHYMKLGIIPGKVFTLFCKVREEQYRMLFDRLREYS